MRIGLARTASAAASLTFGYDLNEERAADHPMSTDSTAYLQTLFGLDGRVAVVTGGASGLGAAFSKGLAAVGATVVIADINPETAAEVIGEIEAAGGTAEFRSVDVTDVPAVNAFADGVVAAHGHVDVLINSAGAAHRSPIEDFAESACNHPDPGVKPEGHLLHEPGDREEDARPGQGQHHQHRLNRRLHCLSLLHADPGEQGRGRSDDEVVLARVERESAGERGRPRLCDTPRLRRAC